MSSTQNLILGIPDDKVEATPLKTEEDNKTVVKAAGATATPTVTPVADTANNTEKAQQALFDVKNNLITEHVKPPVTTGNGATPGAAVADVSAQTNGKDDNSKTFTQQEIDAMANEETQTGATNETSTLDATKGLKVIPAYDVKAAATNAPKLTSYAVDKWKNSGDNTAVERFWEDTQKKAHTDFITALNEYAENIKPETKEEKERREKAERRSKLFSAIGDGISALSNLYFTTKGAPNMYEQKNSLSGRVQERIDKMKKERDADHAMWLKVQTSKMASIDDLIKQDRENKKAKLTLAIQAQTAANEAAMARARARMYEAQGNSYAAQVELRNAQAKEAEAKAKEAESNAQYADRINQSIVDKNEAAANASNSDAQQSQTAAGLNRVKARNEAKNGGSSGKYYATFNGKSYATATDYEQAVYRAAKQHNVPVNETVKYTDSYGLPASKVQKRPASQVAAEVEEKINSQYSDITM